MLSTARQFLLVILMLVLPAQAWAAVQMQVGMGLGLVSHQAHQAHQAIDDAHGSHAAPISPSDHGRHAVHGSAAEHAAPADHDCCAGTDAAHDLGSHSACGETCHCCLTGAPPAVWAHPTAPAPRHEWVVGPALSRAEVSVGAPDKPPKG